jgi:hypothetical protein
LDNDAANGVSDGAAERRNGLLPDFRQPEFIPE